MKQAFLTKDDVNNLIAFDQKNQGIDDLPRNMPGPRNRKADALYGAKQAVNVARGALVGGPNPNTDAEQHINTFDEFDHRKDLRASENEREPNLNDLKPGMPGPLTKAAASQAQRNKHRDEIFSESEADAIREFGHAGAKHDLALGESLFETDAEDYIGEKDDFATRVGDGELTHVQDANYEQRGRYYDKSIQQNVTASTVGKCSASRHKRYKEEKIIPWLAKKMAPEHMGEQAYQASGKSIGWNAPYFRKYPAVPFKVGSERAKARTAAAQKQNAAVSAAIQNAPEISNEVENNPPPNFGEYSNDPVAQAAGGGSGDQPPIDNITTDTPPMDDNFNRSFGNAQRPSRKPRSQAVPQVSDFGNAGVPVS